MSELLRWSMSPDPSLGIEELATRLLISLVLGCAVAVIYAVTQRKRWVEMASMVTTLVLLTILIAMVTLVIGTSLARAFGLVGALAIVRFRTIVEDTRDTAYVIFAVTVGMGVGAGLVQITLIGIPIIATAALALSYLSTCRQTVGGPLGGDCALEIRLGLGHEPASFFRVVFDRYLATARLRSTTTARQGAALDLNYVVRLRREEDAVALVTELNQMEGVQSVDLRQL